MDKGKFFNSIRSLFGHLSLSQVQGIEAILDEAEKRGTPRNWLAYVFATAFHETARTMQPIREFGRGRGMKYGTTYYGRGLVQLTWKYNYEKAGKKLGVDFVTNPDRVLESRYAIPIAFDGMEEGWFTGKDLAKEIDLVDESDTEDAREFREARRIINGTDRAQTIAGYGITFEKALKDSGWENDPRGHENPVVPPVLPVPPPKPQFSSLGKPGNVPMNIGGS